MANNGNDGQAFRIHEGEPEEWLLVADTSLAAPHDFTDPADRQSLASPDYLVGGRSVVVLCRRAPVKKKLTARSARR
jgi:hypothetical protein